MNALLEYEQYMPHGMCLLWEPWLVVLWAGSDLLIFLAYMLIPLALIMVLRKRPDIRHRGLVTLAASFVLLCGVTHAMSIVTLWTAIYPLMGAVKLATGIVSIITAAVLFRLIPTLVRIPSPDKHEEVIAHLRTTLGELTDARDQLEERVQHRTDDLKSANLRLAYVARDAVQRSRNLIRVVSSLTQPGVDAIREPESFVRELRGRINALTIATSTVMEQDEQSTALLQRVVRRQIDPLFADPANQLHVEGPAVEVGAQGAQQISLAMWELASRLVQSGLPASELPQIHVQWSLDAASDKDQMLSIEWRESRPGSSLGYDDSIEGTIDEEAKFRAVDLSEFASTLLTRIIPKMLGGKGEIIQEPDAFIYRLTCPLDALTDVSEGEGLAEGAMEEELLAGV
ncbi:HWE histidine kinase domain-containing protein [Erythrobacter sp. THAF29]|uniref:HWE histidine kinase domain-containing protein n=1 Tax=Erythrobacter sp. THAF29 TaxID=2587851 RepID=UPI001269803D|nr:HWE histidine kinase domain-containing protein [Erythrobacter sp. THAF29]QFT77375.1 Blue-light-activated histidine kinase [Erythrobacter sp. THAF29]